MGATEIIEADIEEAVRLSVQGGVPLSVVFAVALAYARQYGVSVEEAVGHLEVGKWLFLYTSAKRGETQHELKAGGDN